MFSILNRRRTPATSILVCILSARRCNGPKYSFDLPLRISVISVSTWFIRSRYNCSRSVRNCFSRSAAQWNYTSEVRWVGYWSLERWNVLTQIVYTIAPSSFAFRFIHFGWIIGIGLISVFFAGVTIWRSYRDKQIFAWKICSLTGRHWSNYRWELTVPNRLQARTKIPKRNLTWRMLWFNARHVIVINVTIFVWHFDGYGRFKLYLLLRCSKIQLVLSRYDENAIKFDCRKFCAIFNNKNNQEIEWHLSKWVENATTLFLSLATKCHFYALPWADIYFLCFRFLFILLLLLMMSEKLQNKIYWNCQRHYIHTLYRYIQQTYVVMLKYT